MLVSLRKKTTAADLKGEAYYDRTSHFWRCTTRSLSYPRQDGAFRRQTYTFLARLKASEPLQVLQAYPWPHSTVQLGMSASALEMCPHSPDRLLVVCSHNLQITTRRST
eukprot:3806999-Amphidinium_carterae.1